MPFLSHFDSRTSVAAAITLADEWAEANTRVRELEAELRAAEGSVDFRL